MPPQRFNVDTQNFLSNRQPVDSRFPGESRPQTFLEPIQLPNDPLLEQSIGVTREMLAGEVPQDVQDFVVQMSSEQGLQSGLGQGQSARNLVARDLGLTSFDIQNQGLQHASTFSQITQKNQQFEAQLNTAREQFNEELNLNFQKLREDMRQWDDRFTIAMQESDLAIDSFTLRTAELISLNQRFMTDVISRMVIANSQFEISGLQENIGDIRSFFNTTNEGIINLLGISDHANNSRDN